MARGCDGAAGSSPTTRARSGPAGRQPTSRHGEVHAPEQVVEAEVGTEGVPPKPDVEVGQPSGAFLGGSVVWLPRRSHLAEVAQSSVTEAGDAVETVPPSPGPLPASADDGEALGHPSVAKPPVEEPDAAEPARPDLWGARVSDDPGLPDPETNTSQTSRQHTCRRRASCRRTAPGTRGRSCNVQLLDRMLVLQYLRTPAPLRR